MVTYFGRGAPPGKGRCGSPASVTLSPTVAVAVQPGPAGPDSEVSMALWVAHGRQLRFLEPPSTVMTLYLCLKRFKVRAHPRDSIAKEEI